MNHLITSPERIILESLAKSAKSLQELCHCTNLSKNIIQNIVHHWMNRGLVKPHKNKYQLNANAPQLLIESINGTVTKKVEAQALIESCLSLSLTCPELSMFKFRKLYLDESDKKMLKAMLVNLESFIENHERKKYIKTKDETVIFWGQSLYGDLLNNLIEN